MHLSGQMLACGRDRAAQKNREDAEANAQCKSGCGRL